MTVFFGDGRTGARLPTGRENVKAVYRSGIGKPGNVASGQISLLASRPLGVKEVINPLASSGGADPDSRDQARENIPIALQALDRLVSVRDYGDFARAFAGVGKALATRLSDGRRQRVHVTIAGLDDIPILESSDLFVNLAAAFHRLGEPALPVTLQLREQILLVVTAVVRIHPDYDWLLVQPKIRAALLDRFGFTRQVLGVGVSSSAVIAAIQAVPGVTAVDLDAFGGIPERVVDGSPPVRRLISPAEVAVRITDILGGAVTDASPACGWPPPFCPVRAQLARIDQGTVAPAQLVVLNPAVPATLALTLKET
jgi:predicted phage baseplate assembly protein